jgi:hypothetical protein
MKKEFACRLGLFVLSVLCAESAIGQTGDGALAFALQDSIKEVVVTGMRPTYDLSAPAPVQSLKGRDLERINSLSVADAVRYFSGVQIKDYGGIGGVKTVNIRSMGSQHVGVFYDGIALGNAQNGTIDLGKFSLDNMEAIDLYNAQKSDIFQSAKDYGSAGAIYLRSIKPSFAEGQKSKLRFQNKTALYQGMKPAVLYGLTNPSLLWQQKVSDKLSSTFSAEWTEANGKYRFTDRQVFQDGRIANDTTEIRQNSDINALRVEGGFNGALTNGEWNAKAYFYTSERGVPGPVVRNISWRNQRIWDRNFFVQSSFRKAFGERYEFMANGKYASDYTRFVSIDPALQNYDIRYLQQEFYGSAIQMYHVLPILKISLSTDFQYNRLDAEGVNNFSRPQRYTTLIALASALDVRRLKLQASLLANLVREQTDINAASPDKNVFTPAVFASYRLLRGETFYVRAFYKQIFRMPTFNDMYYTLTGNSMLKPERAEQYNIGITGERMFRHAFFYRASIRTDAYYNKITDKIVAFPGGSMFRWTMLNLGKTDIRGVDVSADATCRIRQVYATLRLSYTCQRAIDVTDPTDSYYRDQIPYIPRHDGSAIVNAVYKTWGMNYSFIYVGERYDSQANILENYHQPWYTHDLSVSKDFSMKTLKVKIMAEMNNLLNQYYDIIINYPMPGRHFKLTLTVNI